MAMVIIGGTGTLLGPDRRGGAACCCCPRCSATCPILPPTEIGSIQQMVYGLAMVLLMIFRPAGLWG